MATHQTSASTQDDKPADAVSCLGDIGKLIENFKLPGIDLLSIIGSQLKDIEALAEANREPYEGLNALAERRNEILKESLAQWQQALMDAGGKEALARHAELVQDGVKQAMADFRELAEMEAVARGKAWKVLQDRFQENLANLQKLLQPK
jgi:phasin family protein